MTKPILATFIALLIAAKIAILLIGVSYSGQRWYEFIKTLAAMSKFECMAIGALGGFFLHKNEHDFLQIIDKPWLLNLSILSIPLLILFTPALMQDGIHIVFSLIFLIIIINVATSKRLWINLENGVLSYLGKISYGIYMYHLMIIPIVLVLFRKLSNNSYGFWQNLIIYSTTILTTILISGLSYNFIEGRFIKMKGKFSSIKSGGQ